MRRGRQPVIIWSDVHHQILAELTGRAAVARTERALCQIFNEGAF
jgi:hypothetical protein